MLNKSARIHFVGIGGIGMSALAQVLLSRGYIVSGSDINLNNLTRLVEFKGGRIYKGHDRKNVGDAEIVVYSTAVSKDNPELLEAAKRHLKILHRGELLGELMKDKIGVAVTGAHGKTTTTSMLSDIMIKARLDPVCILGGESVNLRSNAYAGKGKYLIAEADESDGSHLYLNPKFAILTNVDREHVDYYENMEELVKINRSFLKRIHPDGIFFGLIDNEFIRKILLHYDRRFATFGLSKEADLHAANIHMEGMISRFDCIYHKENLGTINIKIPGIHNVLNALAASIFALHIGIDFNVIRDALSLFKSSKRRFEVYPDTDGITLVEDYAHHPTEISAALEACRLLKPRRLITVFQPHRYTRTKALSNEFGLCFGLSDELILTNIYAASEPPIEGVTVKNIYDKVLENNFENVHIMPKENIADYLYNSSEDGDLIAVLGAGDISEVAKELAQRFKDEPR
ncbi:MAG: UDP-N-acetylmuramate--L-alanine ligase [Candidatus Omnitrophica bacterium]|nr:UDP-N-acetylmuramate--L-alanine ligase [Candidatus Omnitrophota bacterium]